MTIKAKSPVRKALEETKKAVSPQTSFGIPTSDSLDTYVPPAGSDSLDAYAAQLGGTIQPAPGYEGYTRNPEAVAPIEEPWDVSQDTGKAGQVYRSTVIGLAGRFASIPKSLAIAAAWINKETGIGGRYTNDPRDAMLWKLGEGIDWLGEAASPEESVRYREDFWLSAAPQAVGNMLSLGVMFAVVVQFGYTAWLMGSVLKG